MNSTLKTVLKYLLIVPTVLLSTALATIAAEVSALFEKAIFAWVSSILPNTVPSVILAAISLLCFFVAILLWVLPPTFVLGFAFHIKWLSRYQWGLCISILLFACLVWSKKPFNASSFFYVTILCAIVLLIGERLVSIRRPDLNNWKFLVVPATAMFLLAGPSLVSLVFAQKMPPEARKIWSTVLQKGTWQAINTGSEFAATRQVVFAGDRIVVVFNAGQAGYNGTNPLSRYRVLSLERATGEIKNQMEFIGRWGNMPYLFAANDGNVILSNRTLQRLRPDLVPTEAEFEADHGGVEVISPDGTTLAWQTFPGTTLLDSVDFHPMSKLSESSPVSVVRGAVLANNHSWPRDYPKDTAFITRTDQTGSKLIFHGECGSAPEFLTEQRILSIGCSSLQILDYDGKTIVTRQNSGQGTIFAGVNQGGTRFALQASDERGDPGVLIYERFFIYDVAHATPVATLSVSDLPKRQSWTAFSPDGQFFVAGNPNNLSLYRLP